MKYLLIILLLSSPALAQEMKVEGNVELTKEEPTPKPSNQAQQEDIVIPALEAFITGKSPCKNGMFVSVQTNTAQCIGE